jgi:hypothetical protein
VADDVAARWQPSARVDDDGDHRGRTRCARAFGGVPEGEEGRRPRGRGRARAMWRWRRFQEVARALPVARPAVEDVGRRRGGANRKQQRRIGCPGGAQIYPERDVGSAGGC